MIDAAAAPAHSCERPLAERRIALLDAMAELGLEAARQVQREVEAGAASATDGALAYARVSRAVRLTLKLQSQMIEALKAQEDQAQAAAVDLALQDDAAHIRKCRVGRIVERLVKAEHDDEDQVEALVAEADERLDDEDVYGDLLERPMSEIVARLCRDLGLSPDWSDLAQELWAKDEIESGARGRPFAAVPLPLDGGEARSRGDGSAAARSGGHPHPLPFPHQGGRGISVPLRDSS